MTIKFRKNGKFIKFELGNIGSKDTRSGFGDAIYELGKERENVVALCADLTGSLKLEKFADEFPNRFFSDWNCRS